MENNRKNSIINFILIVMLILCTAICSLIIVLSTSKAKREALEMSADEMSNSYTSEETDNTWDISKNGDGSVMATLSDDGVLTISGIGDMRDWSSAAAHEWYGEESNIKVVVITDGVTRIGSSAFDKCINLTSIEIPNSIISIGGRSFSKCTSLANIKIPDSVTSIGNLAFEQCSGLIDIEVGENNTNYRDYNGVLYTKDGSEIIRYPEGKTETQYSILSSTTKIGGSSFEGSVNLTNIEIPNSVTEISSYAFDGCNSLTSIEIPEVITRINTCTFRECGSLTNIIIPSSVTWIDEGAFCYCISLIDIEIPSGVESIGNSAFEECSSLKSIEIPDNITRIGAGTFSGCSSLISIVIPNTVTSIVDSAFVGCSSLTSIEIPSSTTSIGSNVFSGCSNLASIEVQEGNTNYIDYDGVLYAKDATRIIKYPEGKKEINYTILSGVTRIESGAFRYCSTLKNIIIPNTVISIENNAFEECTGLTCIEIPSGVTSIGYRCFFGCNNLSALEIPTSVTSINDFAFYGCKIKKLIKITDRSIELPDILKRAQDENDILYSSSGFDFTNCTIQAGMIKIDEGKDNATIRVKSGKLQSLTYFAFCDTWDVSINADGSVMATLSDDGVLTISGAGDMMDWKSTSTTDWHGRKDDVKNVIIENGITRIGNDAFYYCRNLTSIEIADSITSIGRMAFTRCDGLASLKIPDGVTQIEGYAFENCTSITSIEIPSKVITLENDVFYGCTSLNNIEVSESNTVYMDVNGVLYTKDGSEMIRYPSGKKETDYTILSTATSVGGGAFEGCESLTCVEIPSSVATISQYAFKDNTSLINIEVDENNPNYMDDKGVLYTKNRTELIRYPVGKQDGVYTIPSTVTSIERHAFYMCKSLTKIAIPSRITSIAPDVFWGCDMLTIICKSGTTAEKYAKDNNINYTIDDNGPEINIAGNWKTSPLKRAVAQVNVTDEVTGIDEGNLKYLWSTEFENITKEQINYNLTNGSGSSVEIGDATGTYYLWVYAIDKLGNETISKEGPIYLDNTSPTAQINYSTIKPTNQDVTVTITASEKIQRVEGWIISTDQLTLTKVYEQNTSEEIIIKDLAGNETTVNVEISNIDKVLPQLIINVQAISDTITVKVEATDEISGIDDNSYRYYIRQEKETYGTAIEGGSSHIFEGLQKKTKYYIKVEVSDKAGNVASKEIEAQTVSNQIKSTELKVDEENLIIKGIKPKTTVSEIRQNLQSEIEYEILDLEGKTATSTSIVGTGFKVRMADGKEYTLIVWGDLDGDGKIKISDLARISRIGVKDVEPSQLEKWAIDVSGDGNITVSDLAAISRFEVQ